MMTDKRGFQFGEENEKKNPDTQPKYCMMGVSPEMKGGGGSTPPLFSSNMLNQLTKLTY